MEGTLDFKKRRAMIYTNLAYILTDVAEGYILDVEAYLNSIRREVKFTEKFRYGQAQKKARELHGVLLSLCGEIYRIRQSEDAVHDADYFKDLFELIVDRIGNSQTKEAQLRAMIYNNFPSVMHLNLSPGGEEIDTGD